VRRPEREGNRRSPRDQPTHGPQLRQGAASP
jgi:hypothetical protein